MEKQDMFMFSANVSLFYETPQDFDVFTREKNQGILPEERIQQLCGGEKFIKGGNANTRAHHLEKSFYLISPQKLINWLSI